MTAPGHRPGPPREAPQPGAGGPVDADRGAERSDGSRHDPLRHDQRRARRPAGATALRRSASERRLAGVAGGIATFTGADPRWVRVLFVVSVPLSLGVTAVGYLLLWGLLPAERG